MKFLKWKYVMDDNEFARYLAQFLYDNFPDRPPERDEIEELIKEFLETLP
jgi:hypothetical protein